MKKLILSLIVTLSCLFANGQVLVFDSEQTENHFNVKFDSCKDLYEINSGNQKIFIKSENMTNFSEQFQKAYNKALYWSSISVSDKRTKITNSIDFTTDGGILFKLNMHKESGPKDAVLIYQKYKDETQTINVMRFSVLQFDNTGIFTAYFDLMFDLDKDTQTIEKFIEFLNSL